MNTNKILIVEDEKNLRETITELLIHNDYKVKCAANGQEAIEILEYWTPDLIISDLMMPVMDGYLLQEIVKNTEMLNQIPFIFLTAKNDPGEMEKCTLLGVDHFLNKPFKIEDLIKIIEVKIERFNKIKNAYNNIIHSNSSQFMHEINTPLYGILGSIDLLIENKRSFEENETDMFYNAIKISGKRLNRTLKKCILFQNFKNNKLEFQNNSYSKILEEFLKIQDEIADMDIDKSQVKRIIFNVRESDIQIKQEYLNFILLELLENALKFSKMNKKIIVSGKKHNTKYYELRIQDYGIGFTKNQLKEINANQQFDRDKREQQGLGLGLFMSKTIVKKIGGIFSINSQKDVGTTIIIYFPLHPEGL